MATATVIGGQTITLQLPQSELTQALQSLNSLIGHGTPKVEYSLGNHTVAGDVNIYNVPGSSSDALPTNAKSLVVSTTSSATVSGSGSGILLVGNDANDKISLTGSGTIIAGDGKDVLSLNGSGSVLAGNGADSISLVGSGTVLAGSGNDTVTVSGGGHSPSFVSITVGAGDDSISSTGRGPTSVVAGDGNDTVSLTGRGPATISVGNGNDSISTNGPATVTAGNGRDTISVASGIVSVGNGNDLISLSGNATVYLGSGNDTIKHQGSGRVTIVETVGGDKTLGTINGSTSVDVKNGVVQTGRGRNTPFSTPVGGHASHLTSSGGESVTAGLGSSTLAGGSAKPTFATAPHFSFLGAGNDTLVSGSNVPLGAGHHALFSFDTAPAAGGGGVFGNFVTKEQFPTSGATSFDTAPTHGTSGLVSGTQISLDGGKTVIDLKGIFHKGHG